MARSAMAQEKICALRRIIARIEERPAEKLEPANPAAGSVAGLVTRRNGTASPDLVRTGADSLDAALGGGLPFAALSEIHSAQTRDAGAAAGFALALAARILSKTPLPLLWIGTSEIFREAGFPYAPGLAPDFGVATRHLLFSRTPKLADALWIAEEAAPLRALCVVILELRGNPRRLDLTATRRLHRRAQEAGRPVFLLRQGAEAEPTAAPVRLVVAPAPAAKRRTFFGALDGTIGPPAFRVAVAKSRHSMPAEFTIEWNADERVFRERHSERDPAPDTGAVAALSADRTDRAQESGRVVALESVA